jgi:hypothetical protein
MSAAVGEQRTIVPACSALMLVSCSFSTDSAIANAIERTEQNPRMLPTRAKRLNRHHQVGDGVVEEVLLDELRHEGGVDRHNSERASDNILWNGK